MPLLQGKENPPDLGEMVFRVKQKDWNSFLLRISIFLMFGGRRGKERGREEGGEMCVRVAIFIISLSLSILLLILLSVY